MCTVVKEDPLFAAEDVPDMLLFKNTQTQHVPVEKRGEFESVVHAASTRLAPPPTNTTNLPWINLIFIFFLSKLRSILKLLY